MVLLGIDPGYERCGFAVLEKPTHGAEKLLYSVCFKTDATLPFTERLVLIVAEARRLIEAYEVNATALEKLYFTSNQKTAMRVAEVRGALLLVACEQGTRVVEYGPGEVKVAVAGDGRADKRQVMSMVRQLIRLEKDITSDDEFDAIAVALTASASIGAIRS